MKVFVDQPGAPTNPHPENDFAGLWELTVECPDPDTVVVDVHRADPSIANPLLYAINPNLDSTFGLNVSLEFAGGDATIRDEWNNTASLAYCPGGGCDPALRWDEGPFDCDETYRVPGSDYLEGTVTLEGELHKITIYLIDNPDDGSTTPVLGYDHDSDGDESQRYSSLIGRNGTQER